MFLEKLQNKILDYYIRYYKSCGLENYLELANARLSEEAAESKRMRVLQAKLKENFQNQKHFILGAGTGGLAIVLAKEYNCSVFGCEPDKEALEIIKEKLQARGIDPSGFSGDFGESLSSFESNQFDFAHCFTVLEHVQGVEKCVQEMIRIVKPGGLIYINTPDYDFPEERHYKIRFPFGLAKMPRVFSYLYLILRGKPYKFLKNINLLNEKQLDDILKKQPGVNFWRLRQNSPTQEIVIQKK